MTTSTCEPGLRVPGRTRERLPARPISGTFISAKCFAKAGVTIPPSHGPQSWIARCTFAALLRFGLGRPIEDFVRHGVGRLAAITVTSGHWTKTARAR